LPIPDLEALPMDTVMITGANRGLGLELAKQYAADGWRVIACSRRSSPGLAGLAGLQSKVRVFGLDVTDHGQMEKLAAELREEAIDVLINNAGTMGKSAFGGSASTDQRFGNIDYDDFEKILQINVIAPLRMAETFVEHVARSRQKKIVTLSSMVGSVSLNTSGGLYGYRASKAAVNAIMKSMWIDLAERGILAVAMHPGWVRTEMGGPNADIDAATSVAGMRRVIATLAPHDLGKLIAYDGRILPY
jgi:NAD(P)-dependent dehydrogenase (short-subunit alcohol dehydrogenase family)